MPQLMAQDDFNMKYCNLHFPVTVHHLLTVDVANLLRIVLSGVLVNALLHFQ